MARSDVAKVAARREYAAGKTAALYVRVGVEDQKLIKRAARLRCESLSRFVRRNAMMAALRELRAAGVDVAA